VSVSKSRCFAKIGVKMGRRLVVVFSSLGARLRKNSRSWASDDFKPGSPILEISREHL
jgi:hypothetical protein